MLTIARTPLCLALFLFLAIGCASKDDPVEVTGKVTFSGQPVTEGTVQFNNATTGQGAEVELQSDGSYQATLPPGQYQVSINPPYIVENEGSGIPNPKYKKVKNIPKQYQSTATTDLKADVSRDKAQHDFAMTPK